MKELIDWLKALDPMEPKTVVMPNKNFHFELRKSLANSGDLKFLFNCELTTPTGFLNQKLYELTGKSVIDFQDIMYSFKVCLAEGMFDELKYFDKTQLKDGTGYAESFAKTILELDAVGLNPDKLMNFDLKENPDQADRITDVGLIWQKINEIALSSDILNHTQAIAALKDKSFDNVFWMDFSHNLKNFDFKRVDIEFSACTPKNLDIEAWASTEEEDRATLYWIIEKMQKGLRLDELAIITPTHRPRLISYINYYFDKEMVYAASGINNSSVGVGANIRHMLEAIRENLPGSMMPRVFKNLKRDENFQEPEKKNLVQGVRFSYLPYSEEQWVDVVNSTGAVGGNRATDAGVVDWKERIFKYWPETKAYKRGIDLIVNLCEHKNNNDQLSAFTTIIKELLTEHFYVSKADKHLIDIFLDQLMFYSDRPWAQEVNGEDCINFLIDVLDRIKSPCGKLGDPSVFIGSIDKAVGLSFKAARFIGMQEGSFPKFPKQDPILSDDLRAIISSDLKTVPAKLNREVDYFNFLLANSDVEVSLSTYEQNIDGTEKSYSGIFLDLLDRLNIEGNLRDLYKDLDQKRRDKINTMAHEMPYLEFSKLRSIKRNPDDKNQLIPKRLKGLDQSVGMTLENLMQDEYDFVSGYFKGKLKIDLTQTLSPSMVGTLLSCPRRYLFSQVLGFYDTDSVVEIGGLDPMSRGTMIHWIIEQIDRDRGFVALGKMEQSQKEQTIKSFIDKCISEFPIANFFGSQEALNAEIEKYEDIIAEVITRDTELDIIETIPEKKIEFTLDSLKFRGKVDRIEKRSNGKVRIVDFKSGRGYNKDREKNPFEPGYDIQLLLYMHGLTQSGEIDRDDVEALEFRYPESNDLDYREFKGDDLLELWKKGEWWFKFLILAHKEQFFPPVASESNCKYCEFADVCDKNTVDYEQKDPFNTEVGSLFHKIFYIDEADNE